MTYEAFISRFEHKDKTQHGFMVCCPAHPDSIKGKSLHICPARDGGVLLKCFAGCTTESVVAKLGLGMKDLFAKEAVKKFIPPPPREESTKKKCDDPDVKPQIEKIYSYQDANGREVYQAIRMKPKSFRQRHFAEGNWEWNMDGVERVLYRLPKILAAKQVWIVEGEKDAENLSSLGFEATCNVGGAGKWLDSYSESLIGKEVVICGDNDEPGKKHVELVFESLAGKAKSVKILKLPEATKDVSDYIATFKESKEAAAALNDLASDAHPHVNGKSLPLYTISELEDDYRRFVRSMGTNSFSWGLWLPTLGVKLRPSMPGELVFIIGDTGTGKTGLLQNIAKAAKQLPRIMFELELPKEAMFERFATMSSRMTGDKIEEAYQSCDESSAPEIDNAYPNLLLCPVGKISVKQIEDIVMRSELKLGERPKMVLIDYIQLISATGANRREKISDVAEELKIMAKTTRTIVVVASQIARPKDVGADWEPSLHSAKESGSIESSCGLLISAWQDMKEHGALNLRVLKATRGGTGTFVQCNFDGARMIITERSKFSDVAETRSPYN